MMMRACVWGCLVLLLLPMDCGLGVWTARPFCRYSRGLFLVTCVGTPVAAGSLSCLWPCSTGVAGGLCSGLSSCAAALLAVAR